MMILTRDCVLAMIEELDYDLYKEYLKDEPLLEYINGHWQNILDDYDCE